MKKTTGCGALLLAIIAVIVAAIAVFIANAVLWPVGTGWSAQELGSKHGQYQLIDGGLDYHRGIDILVPVSTMVFAAEAGTVRRINLWGTNSELVIESDKHPGFGFRYQHLAPESITVLDGTHVDRNDHLGNTADFGKGQSADKDIFNHLHLEWVKPRYPSPDTGLPDWDKDLISYEDPLARLIAVPDNPPVANLIDGKKFLFIHDGTLSVADPLTANGKIDIVVRAHDYFAGHMKYKLVPAKLTLRIESPSEPPIERTLNVNEFPIAYNGQTAWQVVEQAYPQGLTQGNFSQRDFYFIVTHGSTDPDEAAPDKLGAWDTQNLSGEYTITVVVENQGGGTAPPHTQTIQFP